ncbi:MAG: porin [Pseudomonadota bacterium]
MKSWVARMGTGLAAGVCSAAFAQDGIQLYGIVDAGVECAGGGKGTALRVVSGNISPSRLGIAGTEQLGGGTSVLFKLENGFAGDTGQARQGGALFGREAWVGLAGNYGQVQAGVNDTPLLAIMGTYSLRALSDGIGSGHAAINFAGPATRISRSLRYTSPVINHFTYRLAYGLAVPDATSPRHLGQTAALSMGYRQRRFSADIASLTQTFAPVPTALNAHSATAVGSYSEVGASYDFGFIKPALLYQRHRGGADVATASAVAFSNPHADLYERNATMPAGRALILLSVGQYRKTADGNGNASAFGARYNYPCSVRAVLYAGAAGIRNASAAAFSIKGQSDGGIPVAPGAIGKALLVGIEQAC